tara:strand:+ start:28 stop:489 length:462 start_codon:yes stop_codon:yes gene_type:complete
MARVEQHSVYGDVAINGRPHMNDIDDGFLRHINVLDACFKGDYMEKTHVLFKWDNGGNANSGGQSEIPMHVELGPGGVVLHFDANQPLNVYTCKEKTTKNTKRSLAFTIIDPDTKTELVFSDYFIRFEIHYDDNIYYHEVNTRPEFIARHLHN